MAVTFPPDTSPHPTDTAEAEARASTPSVAPAQDTSPPDDDLASERAYARNVAWAWLIGILAMSVLVTLLVLLAGGADDIGVGGSIAVGLACGFWLAPLAGVIGIGRWASRWHQH